MEFNKPMDVFSFDWDDSELIEAYDRAMNNGKSSSKSKKNKISKGNVKEEKEKAVKNWKIGDYCRAIYLEDGLYYEAVIVDVQDKSCTIEFLGYGDCVEVSLDSMLPSAGKKARQKQRKSVKKAELSIYTSDTDYSHVNETKDMSRAVKSVHVPVGNTTADQPNHHAAAGYAQHQPHPHMQQHPVPPHLGYSHNMHTPMVSVPEQNMGGAPHCLPPPPPPAIPPCTATSNDPALSAMLLSWYMAGYYTGLNQSHKSSHCPAVPKPHCCAHQAPNHCGHFY